MVGTKAMLSARHAPAVHDGTQIRDARNDLHIRSHC